MSAVHASPRGSLRALFFDARRFFFPSIFFPTFSGVFSPLLPEAQVLLLDKALISRIIPRILAPFYVLYANI